MFRDLREYLEALRREGDLVEVDVPVDPHLEIAEIHRRVIAEGGPALLFRRPKHSPFPVVTNLFGTPRRLELAFGGRPETFVRDLVSFVTEHFPPSLRDLWERRGLLGALARIGTREGTSERAPVTEVVDTAFDLTRLPALTSWPMDGGPFLTLPLVYTEDPRGRGSNLGMYRMQIKGPTRTGMHWQIHRGGGFHYHAAEAENRPLPVSVFLGGPPSLVIAAIAPLPENVPELLLASLLMGDKIPVVRIPGHPHPLVATAEFALLGEVPPRVREPEGPFGDHYGYYSLVHDFPVFDVRLVAHRKDALFPATVVGKPRQEDYYIGEYLQRLLAPVFPLVMPGVRSLWSYGEAGFHPVAAAVLRESYPREAFAHALRILGEGQLTLTKFLLATDADVDVRDFRAVLTTVLARFAPERDLYVFAETAMDTLDYTGRKLNHGSKAVLLGVGEPRRKLGEVPPTSLLRRLPRGVEDTYAFVPGTLVVHGPEFVEDPSFPQALLEALAEPRDVGEGLPSAVGDVAQASPPSSGTTGGDAAKDESAEAWPLVVLVDRKSGDLRDPRLFLWTVFTRFDPAHDLYARFTVRNHRPAYRLPLVVDARMKPFYPPEVEPDPETVRLVDRRWREYFPKG
ncbi:UbiD family decarboxylase [Brockia lithotrophica]|uniref:UbiD family decarboxylase n=1 Tax=Brockia lithotrophica TaxID=933949 RepID=A0A660KXT4_9BACL|nr:UbiD family decarboxylase [Brockia lithotrophica]RKQ85439.1 UbiD family decarboxylase [Brockia lithotrophica]